MGEMEGYERSAAYCQDSQQRSLSSILQADHRDIHLSCPVQRERFVSAVQTITGEVYRIIAFCLFNYDHNILVFAQRTHQNSRSNQSYTLLKMPAMVSRADRVSGLKNMPGLLGIQIARGDIGKSLER